MASIGVRFRADAYIDNQRYLLYDEVSSLNFLQHKGKRFCDGTYCLSYLASLPFLKERG